MTTIYTSKTPKNKKRVFVITKTRQFFNLALSLIKNKNYIYRGISHDNEKYPKIVRKNDFSEIEINILSEFERFYGLFTKSTNYWEFLAIAQHHGLMTRLIDFTTNFFVAAFFSLHQSKKSSVHKIIAIDKNKFKKISEWKDPNDLFVSEPDDKMSSNVKMAFDSISTMAGNYILVPDYSSNRLFVQQGLFVVPGSITKKHIDDIYANADIEITINKRVRFDILKKLKIIGFDEFRLMPDLDNVCREINQLFINIK